ncbi:MULTISPECIES: hypothetical protein [Pontibacillus]|uniref:Uncharacterized protein n=1 Tax=Pontibacillus chungwhensis TaxID=265426 RepID=A0ABY8V1C7_9BACI|nr:MULTISPECIES: hypothetical protein [Pontibacillus]MCD5325968.1 hypothetical protein [Pontibacillus sp. HN14]WIF98424.1 hypothetical protein QNI29_01770 [Pontibacillus chungwhensis]
MDHPTREEFEKLKREVEDLKKPNRNTTTEVASIIAGAAVAITAIIGIFW